MLSLLFRANEFLFFDNEKYYSSLLKNIITIQIYK